MIFTALCFILQGVLYFKSTCIGTSSQRSYKVKNTSRIALKYQWKVPHHQRDLLSVYPITGIILPNETQVLLQLDIVSQNRLKYKFTDMSSKRVLNLMHTLQWVVSKLVITTVL